MPSTNDTSSSPFRLWEWLRLGVACVTNFSLLAAPCHGFTDTVELPTEPADDAMLLAALLPELAVPVLDAGGSPRVAASAPAATPRAFPAWTTPTRRTYWRSPQPLPARPATLLSSWQAPAPRSRSAPALILPTDPGPWQPSEVPQGTDPAPPAGNFGALPIEQEAGNCVVFGEVASGLDPVPNAIVDIIGTGRVAETDAQGRFRIEGLPPGDYIAEASSLNHSPQTLGVSPNPTAPVELRFNLTVKPADSGTEEYTLEEESVVGEYQESSQGDLFLDLEVGQNIAAGIGKEEFTSSGVSDAAGAVSKIAGANIVGGKYAVVRGLGDRYSNTLVNGALISSADPSKKAVQLDLFPTDLLESVAINKTFSPDLPAEFAGGIVLVETLRLPKERILEFEVGIETNSNFDDVFYQAPGGSRDFWGNRAEDIPLAELPGGILSSGHTGRRPPRTTAELAAAAAAAAQMQKVHESAGMKPEKRKPREKESFAATYGDRIKLKNGLEIGGVVAFTHEDGDQVREDMQVGRGVNFGSDQAPGASGDPGSEDFVVRTQQEDRYTSFVNWGMLAGAGLKMGENHQVGFTWLQNKSAQDQVSLGRKINEVDGLFPNYLPSDANPFGAGAVTTQAFDSIQPLVRELETRQIDGSHRFGEDGEGIGLDWLLARSEAIESRPNSRTLFFSELDFTDPRIQASGDIYNPSLGVVYTAADPFSSSPPLVQSFRESLETNEEAGNEALDLTFPLWSEDDDSFFKFKIGGNHFARDREVRGRLFTYDVAPGLNNVLLGNSGQNGVDYLNGIDSPTDPSGNPRFFGWTGPQASNQSTSLILTEATLLGRTVRNVDAGNEVNAAYLMGNGELGGWGFVGGVRLEGEDRYYQVLPGLNAAAFANANPVNTKNQYALPGFTLWRNFGHEDRQKVTIAWSRTVARPTFYEYAPVEIQDQSTGDIIIGNPDLTDTLIENFDLRFDWNPIDTTRFSVNLFHKAMTDPIAQAFELEKRTWVNGEQGTLQGLEFELSHLLGGGFDFSSNFTYIDSLLQYRQEINSSGDFQLVNSSFEGQPKQIFNFLFGYEHPDYEFKTSLVYNFTGSYLTGVPATVGSPTVLRESFSSLDLVISKTFELWECDGTVKLKIGNLLDSEDTQVFAPTELVFQSFSPGRSLSLSADFAF